MLQCCTFNRSLTPLALEVSLPKSHKLSLQLYVCVCLCTLWGWTLSKLGHFSWSSPHTHTHTHSPGHCPDADGGEEASSNDHPTPASFRRSGDLRLPSASLELLLFGDCHRSGHSDISIRPASLVCFEGCRGWKLHSSMFSFCLQTCRTFSLAGLVLLKDLQET